MSLLLSLCFFRSPPMPVPKSVGKSNDYEFFFPKEIPPGLFFTLSSSWIFRSWVCAVCDLILCFFSHAFTPIASFRKPWFSLIYGLLSVHLFDEGFFGIPPFGCSARHKSCRFMGLLPPASCGYPFYFKKSVSVVFFGDFGGSPLLVVRVCLIPIISRPHTFVSSFFFFGLRSLFVTVRDGSLSGHHPVRLAHLVRAWQGER